MLNQFRFAPASIAGTEHIKPDQPGFHNNQDAYSLRFDDTCIVGIVSDGCGSGGHSELGSRLGSRIIANKLFYALHQVQTRQVPVREKTFVEWRNEVDIPTRTETIPFTEHLEWARTATLHYINELVGAMGPSDEMKALISDCLLFTVVGFVMTPEMTHIFSLGDGVFALNGEVTVIPPMEGNRPVYMTYALTGTALDTTNPDLLRFTVQKSIPTAEVESLLVGTDGCTDIIEKAELKAAGGDTVGSLAQFWHENMMLAKGENGEILRVSPKAQRRLNLLNESKYRIDRDNVAIVKKHGILHDDSTLISCRRMP